MGFFNAKSLSTYSVAWFGRFVASDSLDTEQADREAIFHTLLNAGAAALVLLTVILLSLTILRRPPYTISGFVSPLTPLFLAIGMLLLKRVSRVGHYTLAAWIFLTASLLLPAYVSIRWGVGIPQSLLTYVLIILMVAILLGAAELLFVTLGVSIFMAGVLWLQQTNILQPDLSWRTQLPHMGNAVAYGTCLLLIALVSWLFQRQSRNALCRARESEKLLREERDQLEKTVYLKTQQLRQSQTDRLNELAKLAEFGAQASSFFHDIVNPINVIGLSLAELQSKHSKTKEFREIRTVLRDAIRANQKVDEYIAATRSNLRRQGIKDKFSVYREMDLAVLILLKRAKKLQVDIEIISQQKRLLLEGNKSRFHQVMSNLISNALDAYEKSPNLKQRLITLELHKNPHDVTIEIQDWAGGIKPAVLDHIFEPFFSTKSGSPHLGIGLSICKQVVEQELHGTLSCRSDLKTGSTTFTLCLPH